MKKIVLSVREILAIRNESENLEWPIRQRSHGLTCGSRASRWRRTALFLVLMLFVSGSAVFAHPPGGHGPHGGMHHGGPARPPMHGPVMPPPPPPVMHVGIHHIPVGVIPTRHPRVFVGARINPYYYADCINPMGYYDPYYCGTYYAPGVVRFSLPRAGITFAF